MLVNGIHYKTVWYEKNAVHLINQNQLPFEFEILVCKNYRETAEAIRNMNVRGAGAIGCTAAFAMAQACTEYKYSSDKIKIAKDFIENTRPTAQNLFYASNAVYNASKTSASKALEMAMEICQKDTDASRRIGEFGAELIQNNMSIETHCNAGWLAFTDYGTALSPIYEAKRQGKNIRVWVDETRPRNQGARLTAWELKNQNIEHHIIADNAGAFFMQKGDVDLMIVGADRIAANGDLANKIGTLEKAIAAHFYNIPFYVAAPLATFDINCTSGADIPIEFRSENEILFQTGINQNGEKSKIRVCSPNSSAKNPAFDVTPARLIKGIITEKGIINPTRNEIAKILNTKL